MVEAMSTSTNPGRGQLSASAAEIYEEFFVPALFGQWPPTILDAAGVKEGEAVLDVGCGTGTLARAAADRVTSTGTVAAVDVNDGMLAVARRAPEPVDWRMAPAENLPFDDDSFDRVVSQFAMMFFTDRAAATAEMARVTRPGGTATVATWARVEDSPGYAAMVDLLDRLFGPDASEALLAPFSIGTAHQLRQMMSGSFDHVAVDVHEGTARFDSLDDWVHTDIRGWTLAELIDDEQYAELRAAAPAALGRFIDDTGRVSFPAPALIATGISPS